MRLNSYDAWEEKFLNLFEERMDEEAIYPYAHLWKKKLSPQQAFDEYLQENPDYAEKFNELVVVNQDPEEKEDFLKLAKKLEQKKLQKQAEEKLSKFCPECARVIGKKSACKCGYRRPKKKKDEFDF